MTASNDAKAQSSSTKKQPYSHKDKKQETTVINLSSKRPKLLSGISLAIAFVALGGSYFAIKANVQLHQATTQQIQSLLKQIDTLKQQQNDTETQLASTKESLTESENNLQNKVNMVDKRLKSTLQQQMYQSNDWLLLKARYYLELAQINAHWNEDLQTTASLLQQADNILSNIQDQELFIIRQAIAKEIAELKTLPKLDVIGTLSQLDAVMDSIATLPLKMTITLENKKEPLVTGRNSTSSTWRESLKNSVRLLESLVVIRRHNEDIIPLPSPAYESMLREGIRFNLQEAQWALLQNNQPIYQFSLQQSIKNIELAFDLKAPGSHELINQLHALQEVHLVQKKPTLEQSLPLLNQLIESKDTQILNKKPTNAGVTP